LQWSADSSSIYYVDGKGALVVVPAKGGAVTVIAPDGASAPSLSPSGDRLAYIRGGKIEVLTFASGKSDEVSATPAPTLVGWSTQDAILVGGDTALYQVRSDGTGGTQVSSGTYHSPVWAPNGSSFAFVRGNALWVAVAPALPLEPTPVDDAARAVTSFMDARLAGHASEATRLLTDTGKKAYGDGGLNLLLTGEPRFSRYYVLTQELVATQPDTVRFVVRLVLTHGKIDVSNYEETLTLVPDSGSREFRGNQASGGLRRELGKGAEVVSVEVARDSIKVTFDSDLDPGTVSDGVVLLDSKGKQVETTATYANRAVTLSGLDLKEGAQYRLVVLTTVRDVLGHNVAAEYDLDVVGPSLKKHGNHKDVGSSSPSSSSPSPSTTSAP